MTPPQPPPEPKLGFRPQGALTVAVHEFRLRLRAGRWRWLLGTWFLTLFVLTALLRETLVDAGQEAPGTVMFGGLMLFMLALALLVVPSLTAQSINGDRERGVLATLQTTLLTPAEIAIGKLVAAWATAAVFLLVALPLVVWCVTEGASGFRAAAALGVTTLLLGVVCAIAQSLSALLARSTTSAVLSYLSVFALTIGTVIAFALAVVVSQSTETHTADGTTYEVTEIHPERVWWILAPNPFVIVADAAPRAGSGPAASRNLDPLGAIGEAVQTLRTPETLLTDDGAERSGQVPAWPYGLGVNLLLGAGAVMLTTRRLRTPYADLPRSVRVA